MRPTESKIASLLPRIVERAARRSDEKEEEPWVRPPPADSQGRMAPTSSGSTARTGLALLSFVLLPSLLAFFVTGLAASASYALTDPKRSSVVRCVGAPLIHTVKFNSLGEHSQFFPGAVLVNGLLWIGVTAAVWCCLQLVVQGVVAYRASTARRQFTLGQLLALSVGIAMTLAAWRWDLAAARPWHGTLAAAERALEQGMPVGPAVQPLMRFSPLAAAYAYLGVGCAAVCIVHGVIWTVHQFMPRRQGEDKSLLQQIF